MGSSEQHGPGVDASKRPTVERAKLQIIRLDADAEISGFSCGDADLDEFLRDDALPLQASNVTRVYLGIYDGALAGYVALLADTIHLKSGDKRRLSLSHDHPPIPAIKIGRLAVCEKLRESHRGMGTELVSFSATLAVEWAEHIGCRLLTVDAYPKSVDFYTRLGFKGNQVAKERAAKEGDPPPSTPPRETVSMRFDLLAPDRAEWFLAGAKS